MLVPAGRIGGDFFDFFQPTADIRLMLIADVSGKGIPAAMALTLLRATFRSVARDTDRPAAIAARMSAALYDEWRGAPYVTAVIVRVSAARRRLTYANAGHPHGILCRNQWRQALAEGGPPLGLLKEASFNEQSLDLAVGDVCVFVTDGVSEALDGLDQRWDAALVNAVQQSRRGGSEAVSQAVISLAQNGRGPAGVEDWSDDRTVVVLSVGTDEVAVGFRGGSECGDV